MKHIKRLFAGIGIALAWYVGCVLFAVFLKWIVISALLAIMLTFCYWIGTIALER